ncbi:MAG TPA: hypothetical protein VHR45_03555 [Thermoanaerobaculia bacterium]|nr:hypothetical protein [Thermoanaerobaculia bacterium]
MNKRFLLSVVVVFILLVGLGFLVHGYLLNSDYTQLTSLFRAEQDQGKYFPFMLLAHLVTALALVAIYLRGREDKPFLAQGIRFGLTIAALAVIPKFLIYYAVQPMPGIVVFKQIVFDTLAVTVIGIVIARINK